MFYIKGLSVYTHPDLRLSYYEKEFFLYNMKTLNLFYRFTKIYDLRS